MRLLKIVTLGLADKRKVSGSVLFPGIIFRSTVAPCCIRKSAIIWGNLSYLKNGPEVSKLYGIWLVCFPITVVFLLMLRFYFRKRASTSTSGPRADQEPGSQSTKRRKLDSRVSMFVFFPKPSDYFPSTKMRFFLWTCRVWNYADYMEKTIQRLRRDW